MLLLHIAPSLDGPCGLADAVDRIAEFTENTGSGVAGDDQFLQRLQFVGGRFQPCGDGLGNGWIFAR